MMGLEPEGLAIMRSWRLMESDRRLFSYRLLLIPIFLPWQNLIWQKIPIWFPSKKKILHLYMVKYFSFGILLPCLSLSLQIGMFCKTKFCQSRKNGFCATATVARQPLYANSSILYYAADWEASDIWFALCKVDSNRVIEVMQFCSLNWLIKDETLLGVFQQLPAPNFT